MPRRARIMTTGVPVHLVHRGNNRSACFAGDEDRAFYLFHLGRMLARYGCALHAYCLMTNHVHLLLTPNKDRSCALLMKNVAQLHTQYMNRTYGRSGSLWEGRYRSSLVQAEDYLLACYRYIEMNPVRASLVPHPRDYPWSSYRANAEGVANTLLTPHGEYLRLGMRLAERIEAYAALFACPLDEARLAAIRTAVNGGFALGGEAFKHRMAIVLGRRVQPARPGRKPARKSLTDDGQALLELPS
jgi:putative transposase